MTPDLGQLLLAPNGNEIVGFNKENPQAGSTNWTQNSHVQWLRRRPQPVDSTVRD